MIGTPNPNNNIWSSVELCYWLRRERYFWIWKNTNVEVPIKPVETYMSHSGGSTSAMATFFVTYEQKVPQQSSQIPKLITKRRAKSTQKAQNVSFHSKSICSSSLRIMKRTKMYRKERPKARMREDSAWHS